MSCCRVAPSIEFAFNQTCFGWMEAFTGGIWSGPMFIESPDTGEIFPAFGAKTNL